MNRNPAVCLFSLLWLTISLATFPHSSFGQFEEEPDTAENTKRKVQEPVGDAFGALPDEYTEESKSREPEANDQTATAVSDSGADELNDSQARPKLSVDQDSTSAEETDTSKQSEPPSAVKKGTASTVDRPFEERFWQYLRANNYTNWAPAPGSSGEFYAGEGPHGDLLKIYINRTAVGNSENLPMGSVIVQENYDKDKSMLAVTAMYRADGYNPKSGNWYWVKYDPDGTVARTSTEAGYRKICGSVTGCIECHSDAGGGDYVFFNDDR